MKPGGVLPPGLELDLSTGRLSGTPTAPGTYDFTLSRTDLFDTVESPALRLLVH